MIDEAAADKMKWDKTPSRVQPRASHFKFKSRFYLLPELTFELGGKSFQKSWTGSFSLNADSNSCNRKKEQGIIGSDILSQGVFCLDPYQKKYAIIPTNNRSVSYRQPRIA